MNKTTSERFGYKSSSEMPIDNRVILFIINKKIFNMKPNESQNISLEIASRPGGQLLRIDHNQRNVPSAFRTYLSNCYIMCCQSD